MRSLPPESNCHRLLVVDDEPSIRATLKDMLEMEGFQITEAGSAREAMRALEQHDIDLLVTDIHMPEVTGIELAESARAKDAALPILLMSGSEPDQIGPDCGCAFLRKPFSFRELAAKVRELLPSERRTAAAQAEPL